MRNENRTTSKKRTTSAPPDDEYSLIFLAICSYEPKYLRSVRRSVSWQKSSMCFTCGVLSMRRVTYARRPPESDASEKSAVLIPHFRASDIVRCSLSMSHG